MHQGKENSQKINWTFFPLMFGFGFSLCGFLFDKNPLSGSKVTVFCYNLCKYFQISEVIFSGEVSEI